MAMVERAMVEAEMVEVMTEAETVESSTASIFKSEHTMSTRAHALQ